MEEELAGRLRRALEAALLASFDGDAEALLRRAATEGSSPDRRAHDEDERFLIVVEHWGALIRSGIVVLTGAATHRMDRALLTSFGRRVLENREPSPHDESGFIAAIRAVTLNPDDVMLTYVAEAAAAWRAHLPRASVVMLGCACEKLVLMLAEQLAATGHSTRLGKMLAAPAPTPISVVFAEVREILTAKPSIVPRPLDDAIDRRLAAIFDHARLARNAAGHPTGAEITMADAHAGLLLFPGFYGYVVKLLAALATASQ